MAKLYVYISWRADFATRKLIIENLLVSNVFYMFVKISVFKRIKILVVLKLFTGFLHTHKTYVNVSQRVSI